MDKCRPAWVPNPQGTATMAAKASLAWAEFTIRQSRPVHRNGLLPFDFQRFGFPTEVDGKAPAAGSFTTDRAITNVKGVRMVGSWNYPFLTVLQPLAYTIAAGNCAIIKPSELAPHCSAAIKRFIQNYLPEEAYAVLEGPGEVAASLAS